MATDTTPPGRRTETPSPLATRTDTITPTDTRAGTPAPAGATTDQQASHGERWELLRQLDAITDKPMIALSFVWLILLVVDFTRGLSPFLRSVSNGIWALFVLDFAVGLLIAPNRRYYLRANWLTAVSLLVPALRVLRVVRVVHLLRAANAAGSLNLLRLLTSLNRGLRAVRATAARRGLGFVLAATGLVTVAGAAGMVQFESPAALQAQGIDPSAAGGGLASYGAALWWTAMLMTTLGGDYAPRTVEGRVLTLGLAIYAFTVFGYITAAIASHFVGADLGGEAAAETDAATGSAQELQALRQELAGLRQAIERLQPAPAAAAPQMPPAQPPAPTPAAAQAP